MGRSPTIADLGAPARPAPPSPQLDLPVVAAAPGIARTPHRRRGQRTAAAVAALLRLTALILCVASLLGLAAVAVGPRLGLLRIETVLSGSMRPTFAPGDLIVVTPEPVDQVRAGQVISYAIPVGDHHVETHRVVRVSRRHGRPAILTKGDANSAADPWLAVLTSPTAWRERLVIPKAGWVILWLHRPEVQRLAVLAAPAFLAVLWLVAIWRPRTSKATPAGAP